MKIPFFTNLFIRMEAEAAKAKADKEAQNEKNIADVKTRLLSAITIYTEAGFKSVGLHVWAVDGSYAYSTILSPVGAAYKLTAYPKGAHTLESI